MELWTTIAGISGFDDLGSRCVALNVEPEVTAVRPRPLNGVPVNAATSGEGSLDLRVRRGVALTAVQQRGVSSSTLLLFAAIMFMVRAVSLMLGPLLVALADDFGTSIAVAGQLAGHLHDLGNNRAVGWTYFRYVRQTTGPPDWAFADGPGSSGVRSGVELQFPTGPTAHHWHRIRNGSPDHHGGAGRQLTA